MSKTRAKRICVNCNKRVSYAGYARHIRSCMDTDASDLVPSIEWYALLPSVEHTLFGESILFPHRPKNYKHVLTMKDVVSRVGWAIQQCHKRRLLEFSTTTITMESFKSNCETEEDRLIKIATGIGISEKQLDELIFKSPYGSLECRILKKFPVEKRRAFSFLDTDYRHQLADFEDAMGLKVGNMKLSTFTRKLIPETISFFGIKELVRSLGRNSKETLVYFPSLNTDTSDRYSFYEKIGDYKDQVLWGEHSMLFDVACDISTKIRNQCLPELKYILRQAGFGGAPDTAEELRVYMKRLQPRHQTFFSCEAKNLLEALVLSEDEELLARNLVEWLYPSVSRNLTSRDVIYNTARPMSNSIDSSTYSKCYDSIVRHVFGHYIVIKPELKKITDEFLINRWKPLHIKKIP